MEHLKPLLEQVRRHVEGASASLAAARTDLDVLVAQLDLGPCDPPPEGYAERQPTPDPVPRALFYPGARFPSARLAPVAVPRLITHHTLLEGRDPFTDTYPAGACGCVIEGDRGPRDYATERAPGWIERGCLPLLNRAVSTAQLEQRHPRDGTIQQHYQAAAKSHLGCALNEFLDNKPGMTFHDDHREALEAARAVRRGGMFIHAWVTNVDRQVPPWLAEHHEAYDVLAVEAYLYEDTPEYWHWIKSYVGSIRDRGMERKALVGLHAGHTHPRLGLIIPDEAFLRRQVAYVREHLPESPGLALWSQYIPHWVEDCQPYFTRVINEFYAAPAPSVVVDLAEGEAISGTVDVAVRATPGAQPVDHYRYFIDRQMVAESPHPIFRWDTASDGPGEHVLTVHVVDAAHLAGAAQVTVTVE